MSFNLTMLTWQISLHK